MGNQDADKEIRLYEIMDQYDCDRDTAELLYQDIVEDKKKSQERQLLGSQRNK